MAIVVRPNQLREYADRTDASARKIHEVVEETHEMIMQVITREILLGHRVDELVRRYHKYRTRMLQWAAEMRRFATLLRSIADAFEEADRPDSRGTPGGGGTYGPGEPNTPVIQPKFTWPDGRRPIPCPPPIPPRLPKPRFPCIPRRPFYLPRFLLLGIPRIVRITIYYPPVRIFIPPAICTLPIYRPPVYPLVIPTAIRSVYPITPAVPVRSYYGRG